MPLESYRQTRPWSKAIERQVLEKKMPPWFATEGGPFSNDPSLTRDEIQVFRTHSRSQSLAKWSISM